ncbi:MAG: DNA polymerase III subunit chi [Hyphomicrobiales bacterium]|nr:MAG: DNA polymerase III subunit chi [Hyphomicrobiales bacterium]
MTEVLFYHLESKRLEESLPELLEKCVERGWRTVVQTGSRERRDALDAHLWTYRDDGFLPHGTAADGHSEAQPLFLTDDGENPNSATVRFLVDNAVPPDLAPYDRAVFVFDGHDADAVAEARVRWKEARDAGFAVTYWRQNDMGRWEKKA